ncbi:MAG: Smr/MutS family protein [Micropepsaceae bacterium]
MKRRLTPEEQALWDHVTAAVAPRRRRTIKAAVKTEDVTTAAVPGPAVRRRAVTVKPEPKPEPKTLSIPAADPFAAPQMDGKRAKNFLKGALAIEGRIDLHGLTLDLAHKALAGFLMQARGRGHRMVLVITGKGAGKGGALKRLVPLWLSAPPFNAMIAGLAAAQPQHGGEGALYLYLRRKRG